MKWDTTLRAIGVLGILAAYGVFVLYGGQTYPLVVAVIAIVALVSPDVIDQLPFGPVK